MPKSEAKLDYKRLFPDLYAPAQSPVLLEVPPLPFFQVSGEGAPESPAYQEALALLYALSFTIKMSKMGKNIPAGYFDYVVPPLEGLWYAENGSFLHTQRNTWRWVSMIRQPEFVTKEVFASAKETAQQKKPELDFSKVRFEVYNEGVCVQMMHLGPYTEEPKSLALMQTFLKENQLKQDSPNLRPHHEIYLSDPRKAKPERLKTVLRLPVCPV